MEETQYKHDLVTIVGEINKLLQKNCKDVPAKAMQLLLVTDGNAYWIKFLGNYIWSSIEDNRQIDEKTGEKELMDVFLLNAIAIITGGCYKAVYEVHQELTVEK